MMKHYEKPDILRVDNLAEGVYLASGGLPVCGSVYLRGVWHKPTYSGTDMLVFRGCEGCSADDGDGCKILKGKYDQLNPNGDFRPEWERRNYKPEDDPIYK